MGRQRILQAGYHDGVRRRDLLHRRQLAERRAEFGAPRGRNLAAENHVVRRIRLAARLGEDGLAERLHRDRQIEDKRAVQDDECHPVRSPKASTTSESPTHVRRFAHLNAVTVSVHVWWN